MSDYGVKPTGLRMKRFDTILEEINDYQSSGFGIDTRVNTQSFLNVLNTNFADKIAELWEFGAEIYHSLYPSSAEGSALDMAVQFGGNVRELARSTYYPIHCECVEGTVLSAGTMISSNTNPVIKLCAVKESTATRANFNKVKIKVVSAGRAETYTVVLNSKVFSFTSDSGEDSEVILQGLAAAIQDGDFSVCIKDGFLQIEAVSLQSSNELLLTENLTTESVTYLVNFATEDIGEIVLPNGSITNIVTAHTGFISCVNLCGYIAGRERETDAELREAYIDKIFNRSTRMLDSIISRILMNCAGVQSAIGYENDQDEIDEEGRPPHSIEVVVDGGSDYEIAEQILATKAGGINTFGSVEVEIPGAYDEMIKVRFNRPSYVYVWMKVSITMSKTTSLVSNYAELIKSVVIDELNNVEAGTNVIPQKFISAIYAAIPGIDYIDIAVFYSGDENAVPNGYPDRIVVVSARERAVITENRIEVALNG